MRGVGSFVGGAVMMAALAAGGEAAVTETPTTVWLVGDSTMASYAPAQFPLTGWGQALPMFVRPGVRVENKAVSGFSSRFFQDRGHWAAIVPRLAAGDYVLIQFGHNDQKKELETHYADAEKVYPERLAVFVRDAREKGATPVILTPVVRRQFKDGRAVSTLGDYPEAARRTARELGAPCIDLHAISLEKMQALGPEESKKLFNHQKGGEYPGWPKPQEDNTHFNDLGARTVAGWVVADALRQDIMPGVFEPRP